MQGAVTKTNNESILMIAINHSLMITSIYRPMLESFMELLANLGAPQHHYNTSAWRERREAEHGTSSIFGLVKAAKMCLIVRSTRVVLQKRKRKPLHLDSHTDTGETIRLLEKFIPTDSGESGTPTSYAFDTHRTRYRSLLGCPGQWCPNLGCCPAVTLCSKATSLVTQSCYQCCCLQTIITNLLINRIDYATPICSQTLSLFPAQLLQHLITYVILT